MKAILKNNVMKAADLSISAEGILSDVAVLRDVRLAYAKDAEGKNTDVIECVRYDCVDPNTYATFTVKVESTKAVVTQQALESSDEPIYIEIPVKEVKIKPYKIEFGKADVSIVAPYVKLAEN